MISPTDDLDGLFKRLSLANARRVWRDLVQRAERERWSYQDFLAMLAVEEIAHRQQTRLARLTRWAHFPFLKTIDDFTSRISRPFASRCSARRCRRTSSPRGAR
jgi:DNA replication protein DnaC